MFKQLLSRKDLADDLLCKSIDEVIRDSDNEFHFLYALAKCEELEKQYENAGISKDVFSDTIADIKAWALDYFDRTGNLGIDNLWWIRFHLEMHLFKLGRLQYTFTNTNMESPEHDLHHGDNVLGVHIPRTEPLTAEACKKSFQLADAFFANFFPEYSYRYYTCDSWMLSPDLDLFLKPDSHIMQFKNMFHIVSVEESDLILYFIFHWGVQREQALQMEAKTSLQKKVLDYIRSGNKLHVAQGLIPKNTMK